MRARLSSAALAVLTLGVFMCAAIAHAEMSQDEMHATIMAALLSDPRTSAVPPAQLQALVDVLASEASTQGLNAQDIKWQAAAVAATFSEGGGQATSKCISLFPSLCPFSDAFGFTGVDIAIPIILFGTSGLLLFILYEVIRHHKKKLEKEKMAKAQQSAPVAAAPATPSAQTPPTSGVAK